MRPVDLTDPETRKAWLEGMRAQVEDLVGVCEDAIKRPSERFFSRAEQTRRMREIEGNLMEALEDAGGVLRPLVLVRPPPPPAEPDEPAPSTQRPV